MIWKGLKFDGTVHLGHVVQVIIFLAGIFAIWGAMDKRIAIVEHRVEEAAQDRVRLHQQMATMSEAINAMAISQERLNTILAKAWEQRN